jgi:Ser/Thr protein kinase RdoA (MazF antagonist)
VDEYADVLAAVRQRYSIGVVTAAPLSGGVESSVLRAVGDGSDVVIRVSPRWRTLEELSWAYELATYASALCPQALPPVRAADGSLAFEHDGRVVSVFPFVEGRMLDRTKAMERDAAAVLLARLHRVLPSWPAARPRPASGPTAPRLIPAHDVAALRDPSLDEVVARLGRRLSPAITHGDYYRGNVRCVDHALVALFDWDDACYWTLENELAWSVWEFAQADDAAALDLDRAERFLRTYAASGGPVSIDDRSFIIPFIRDDIRTEIREAIALEERGEETDAAYVERSYAAFANLADQRSSSVASVVSSPNVAD